jgi:hypothetical protein
MLNIKIISLGSFYCARGFWLGGVRHVVIYCWIMQMISDTVSTSRQTAVMRDEVEQKSKNCSALAAEF